MIRNGKIYYFIIEYRDFEIYRYAEKHKQDIQIWESKYDILKKRYFVYLSFFLISYFICFSMTVLREEMYTRQTHVRDRFMAKPAVVTYN
jgi:hypothetical protein